MRIGCKKRVAILQLARFENMRKITREKQVYYLRKRLFTPLTLKHGLSKRIWHDQLNLMKTKF